MRYTITPIVGTTDYESNEPWRANRNANNTFSYFALTQFGEPTGLAIQPRLGLLPKWRPRSGRCDLARFVASRTSLKAINQGSRDSALLFRLCSAGRLGAKILSLTECQGRKPVTAESSDGSRWGSSVRRDFCGFVPGLAGRGCGVPVSHKLDSPTVRACGSFADRSSLSAQNRFVNFPTLAP